MNEVLNSLPPSTELVIWIGFIVLSIIGVIVLITSREKFINGKDK